MGGKREDSFHQLNMNLDSKHRLISDDFNFILQRRIPPTKKRKERSREWQNIGYYQDLGQALLSYSRLRTRIAMPSTLNELLELTQALSAQIERIGEQCVSLWGNNPE